jgi:glycosyltransferase involved in cell wall biosynthesis
MTTVWNGVPDVIERALPAQGEPLRVVMVARFADQKDQALLLRAAAMLDTVPFEIVFVGTGIRMEAARSLARALNLHSRVVFLGDRDDVASILAASHIFVLSTKWEGLPLSVIEAMRAGLPVVASNVGGMSELVKDGVTGIMVEPGDAESLAAALERLVLDPELRRRMGSQGRLRYETCFSYEGMLERTRHIYSEVLARPVVAGNAQYLPAEK